MTSITDLGRLAWRYFNTDGVESSGKRNPAKADIHGFAAAVDLQKAEGVATLADFKAMTSAPGSVIIQGKTAPYDGWGGVFVKITGSETAEDSILVIRRTAGGDSYKRVYDGPIYGAWAGVVAAGTAAANAAALQAAINLAVSVGAGAVAVKGSIKIDATIRIPGIVELLGFGAGSIYQPVLAAASELLWYGDPGETMVEVGYQPGELTARGGVSNMRLDGRAIAGRCLSIKDHQSGRGDGLVLTGATVDGLHFTNSTDMSDPTGDWIFRDLRGMFRGGSTDSAIGINFDGVVAPGAGGVTLCTFIKPRIEHANGAAIAIGPRADGMRFIALHTFRDNTETGIGVWAHSTDDDQIISGWEFAAPVITGGMRIDYPEAARGWKITDVNDVDVNSGLAVADGLFVYGAGSPAVDADSGYVGFLYGPARIHGWRDTIKHDAMSFMRWDSTNEVLFTRDGSWKTGGSATRFYNDALGATGAVEMLANNVSGNEAWLLAGAAFTSGVALLTHYPLAGCTWSPISADTYTARVGLLGDFGSPPNNGCYIQADKSVSDFYQLVCASGGTRTTVTTTIPAAIAKIQWRIEVTNVSVNFLARTGTNRDFGVVASITTNLPSALLCFGAYLKTNENQYKGMHLYDFKFSHRTGN